MDATTVAYRENFAAVIDVVAAASGLIIRQTNGVSAAKSLFVLRYADVSSYNAVLRHRAAPFEKLTQSSVLPIGRAVVSYASLNDQTQQRSCVDNGGLNGTVIRITFK